MLSRLLNKRWLPAVIPAITASLVWVFPQPSSAIPAFARKYNVKCYSCHLIPPVLNKTGYMFKRLGYRMPPDNMEAGKPAPKISELDKDIKFSLTNYLALVTEGSFTVEKIKGDDSQAKSSFNFDKALLFTGGSLPETNFSYFAEYKFNEHGDSGMEQAVVGYTAGRANSSFFAKAGEMHMQEGEGTRGAMMFSLFDEPAVTITNASPINFSLDQHPAGVNVGYTWASPFFKQVIGLSAKVTNGLNADGSEILFDSTKNSKDFWFDADYWFGPDGGITYLTYYGRKNQIQNQGGPDQFSFYPTIRRNGIFGNYLFFDKLDVIGGYLRSNDDWMDDPAGGKGSYISNAYRGEVDFYPQTGFALMARYDRINQQIKTDTTTRSHLQSWGVGAEKALTPLGNVVLRGAYTYVRSADPVSTTFTRDKLLKVDIRFMW